MPPKENPVNSIENIPYARAGSQAASGSELKMMASPTSWMTMNGTTPL